MIGERERELLLRVARESITAMLEGKKYEPDVPPSGPLSERKGAFVTLTSEGKLRGCIGRLQPEEPLILVVAEMAVAAARDDYRFGSLDREELGLIRIEISALTPFTEVTDPLEIEVGRHGLLIRKERRSGLLLPQVASKEGWSVSRFLEETCRKAGLAADAWKEGATIESFEAEVWSEGEGK